MDESADSDSDTHIQNTVSVYQFVEYIVFLHVHKKNRTAPCRVMNR